MVQRNLSPQQAKRHVEDVARQASPWIRQLGRLGYAAEGIVYGLVGVLAVQTALGRGGETTDPQGAMATLAQSPFEKALLAIVALGLVGYALWLFVQALLDTENKGSDAKGIASRVVHAGIGVAHLVLAFAAVRLLTGSGSSQGGDQSAQDWTGRLLAQPFGQWLVALVGVIVIGVGLYQFYQAYTAKFREDLKLAEMSANEQLWATRVGRLGYAARGVVFCIIGGFLIVAARQAQAEEARGLGGALQTLSERPWLLGIVAVGFVAYGIFMLVQARYRRMVLA